MLSFFCIPKPFTGHEAIIQRNAIQSWQRLDARIEIFLCGHDAGVAECAAELGLSHIAGIAVNEFGTPLLNSAFNQVAARATQPLLCYVNADIILLSDFAAALRAVTHLPDFLMIGQRMDMDITQPIDFSAADWAPRLSRQARVAGTLHAPTGCDYFVFPRGSLQVTLPPFAVGRPKWDNWFIQRAIQHRLPVIDATADVLAIHQNHGYTHVKHARGKMWEGPEGDQNLKLAGRLHHLYKITNADTKLVGGKLRPAWDLPHLKERLHAWSGRNRWAKQPLKWLGILERSGKGLLNRAQVD
jgi:hypothetical protein